MTSDVLQDDDRILPKQILQIADFFTMGLFAHSKLYHFLFTQPQAHDEQNIILQVFVNQRAQSCGMKLALLICDH